MDILRTCSLITLIALAGCNRGQPDSAAADIANAPADAFLAAVAAHCGKA